MATLTIAFAKLLPVSILVTGLTTVTLQAQKSVVEILAKPAQLHRRPYETSLVTVATAQPFVRPHQRIACLLVIECLLPSFAPPDEVEFLTMVLHVAALTTLVGDGRMKALLGLDSSPQQLVTVEAERTVHSLLLTVTLETVLAPFEV